MLRIHLNLRRCRRQCGFVLLWAAALSTALPASAMVSCQCAAQRCCQTERSGQAERCCQTESRAGCESSCCAARDTAQPTASRCWLECDCPDCDCRAALASELRVVISERRAAEELLDLSAVQLLATTQATRAVDFRSAPVPNVHSGLRTGVPLHVLYCVWLN